MVGYLVQIISSWLDYLLSLRFLKPTAPARPSNLAPIAPSPKNDPNVCSNFATESDGTR